MFYTRIYSVMVFTVSVLGVSCFTTQEYLPDSPNKNTILQIKQPWETTSLLENDFRVYFEHNIDKLDPIEGIWRVSYKTKVTINFSGAGKPPVTNWFDKVGYDIIGVMKNKKIQNQFKGYIIQTKRDNWKIGELKVIYNKIKSGYYEESWFGGNREIIISDIKLKEDDYYENEYNTSYFLFNSEPTNTEVLISLIKLYP